MAKAGGSNLDQLIGTMNPVLTDPVYVFATLGKAQAVTPEINALAIMQFREAEGTTVILPEESALIFGFDANYRCRMITLNVHSSLAAIGFLAAITAKLAANAISVNPVSGFYHDHLFVPVEQAEEALTILNIMSDGV